MRVISLERASLAVALSLVLACSTSESPDGSTASSAAATTSSAGGAGGAAGAGGSGGAAGGGVGGACAARSQACSDCASQDCASVAAVCETDPETDPDKNCKAAYQVALDCACAAQERGDTTAADACFATFHASGPRAGGFDDCLQASCKPACGL